MRLLSQNLILIFSFCDQQEKCRMQALSRVCYDEYIPKIMNYFVIERPFVHLYLSNKKRFLIAYLDNYKAIELPRNLTADLEQVSIEENKRNKRKIVTGSASRLSVAPS